uniref:HipA domain-containing protein n=1 Tax=Sulfuriferula sp. GW6 TaxID=3345112 RepID=UPI0039F72E21
MAELNVWFHESLVGGLSTNEDGRWGFQYDSQWIAERRFAISPHLPLANKSKNDLAHQKTVEWFFENLLPEGVLREKLASEASLSQSDTWGMLAEYGQEGPGALSILPKSSKPEVVGQLTPLPLEVLQDMIQRSKKGFPLMAASGVTKMSLPGTQEKLTLRINDGKLYLPKGALASTHILKPENLMYPFCPANEWFVMNLSNAIGLVTAKANLLTLPNGERAYYVERYDRKKTTNDFVERIHQVDLCQACNVSPRHKYESSGGLEAHDLFSASNLCQITAQGIRTSMQWIAFNYLIGNNDAHAKNASFFMRTEKLNPTPFYDLLCVEAYIESSDMAMSIGGEIKAGWVEGHHWDAMALESGNDPRALRLIVKDLTNKVEKALPDILKTPVLTSEEKDFVSTKILPVMQERLRFAKEAMQQPPLSKGDIAKCASPHIADRIAQKSKEKEDRARGR